MIHHIKSQLKEIIESNLGKDCLQSNPDFLLLLASIPEPKDGVSKKEFINGLDSIKRSFMVHGVNPASLLFLDELSSTVDNSHQICSYKEPEDSVKDEDIKSTCITSLSHDEGIIGIKYDYSYEQLKNLSNKVYSKVEKVNFFVNDEVTLNGKIIAEVYDTPQTIPVAFLTLKKSTEEDLVEHKRE